MDLRLLRNNARAFRMSAERSLKQEELPDGKIEMLLVPAVVALAFSIELYFKFFLLAKNAKTAKKESFVKTHDLSKLFASLDPALQQDICDSMCYDKNSFESLLTKHTNAFVVWRYLHETVRDINANLLFLTKLVDCIERRALTILLAKDSENGRTPDK